MLGYAWQKGWVPLLEGSILKSIELNALAVDLNQRAFAWGRAAAHDLPAVEKMSRAGNAVAQVVEFKRNPPLGEVIAKRIAWLSEYQNPAYAAQYSAFVEQVQSAENRLGESGQTGRLTAAVARYLYKLMAYKDEYEVARLYANQAFSNKITAMFEGDYRIKFHLAPPLFARRDANGHLIKQEFGPWMMRAFRLLARCKFLRGSALDIFGHTEERKMERALIAHYRQTISSLLPRLTAKNLTQAIAIAAVPEHIRGYGHVKERHVKEAAEKEAALLADFTSPVIEDDGQPVAGQHAA